MQRAFVAKGLNRMKLHTQTYVYISIFFPLNIHTSTLKYLFLLFIFQNSAIFAPGILVCFVYKFHFILESLFFQKPVYSFYKGCVLRVLLPNSIGYNICLLHTRLKCSVTLADWLASTFALQDSIICMLLHTHQ